MKGRKYILSVSAAVAAALSIFAVGCSDKNDGKKPNDTQPCVHASVTAQSIHAPDCTNDGLTAYVCDKCHEKVREEVVPADGHDYSDAEVTGKCVTCEDVICSPGMTYSLTADGRGYIVSDPAKQCGDNVVVPEYHDGKPVVEIASDAFNGRANVKSASIPKTIETINVGVFNGCTGLEKVYYNAENAADFRGINWVFYCSKDAPELSVTIGKNCKRIPARLFYPHNAYSDIIPKIKSLAFESGTKLEEIGEYAFYKTNMTDVTLPDSLKIIGAHAFESSSVTAVVFGAALETVGAHAFDYCNGLTEIDMSATALKNVEDSAFRNCGELADVVLPTCLETVGTKAFYNCVKLGELSLGGAKHIGDEAFYGCSSLGSLTLPRSLVDLGCSAFEACSGLTEITVEAESLGALDAGNRAFFGSGADGGVKVVIADGVRALPERLFFSTADTENNIRISRLYICRGLERIGKNAFRGVTVDAADFAGTAAEYALIEIAEGNGAIGVPNFGAGRA